MIDITLIGPFRTDRVVTVKPAHAGMNIMAMLKLFEFIVIEGLVNTIRGDQDGTSFDGFS